MTQHDMNIANQSFPAFRTDLNNALTAINTMHSGTSRPSGATTGTLWLDTTNSGSNSLTIKFYDGSDDITFATVNTSANTVDFTDSSVTFDIVNDTSPQLGGNLDTNSHNIIIDDAHFISDENNNEQIIFQTTASAVNELEITNGATGNPPILGASGETNVDLHLKPKGSGETIIGSGGASATLTTSGTYDLILDTNKGTNSGNITITDGANGDITLTPNGTGRVVIGKASVPAVYTGTGMTLDFDTYQNFILTLSSGSNSLANPSTEASNVGQTGVIIFIQPSSSSAGTVSLGTDYETAESAGLTLSSANNDYDVVPYVVKADNSILLGTPQLNFG
tara:strand:+ start:16050 stop:17060 length:1011 start_codon:yes stop_codon:yes gene_type:complete